MQNRKIPGNDWTRASGLLAALSEPQKLFWLLLLVTFLKGAVWSIIVPVWEANDEDQHFGYAQEIVRQGTLAVRAPQTITEERAVLWNLAAPSRLSYQREPIDLSPAALPEMDLSKSKLATADLTRPVPPVWYPEFVTQHPPLYYLLQAMVHQLGAARSILVRMSWMRLLSVLMGVAAIGCVYGTAQTLWSQRKWFPLAVATLTSFHPLFTFFTSVVNNQALELLCFAGVAWLAAVIVRNGMTLTRGLMLGLALAAGLLTRGSFAAVAPLCFGLLVWDLASARKKFHWLGWVAAIALPIALASWWYFPLAQQQGIISNPAPEMVAGQAPPAPVRISAWDYLRTYPWLTNYGVFLREWWGAFGWRDTFYPFSLYLVLQTLTALSLVGFGVGACQFILRYRRRDGLTQDSGDALAFALAVLATLGLIGYYNFVDYRWLHLGGFKIVGRYFLAGVAPQMLALAAGWAYLGRRWVLPALCVGMIVLNVYTLYGLLVPRYYSEQIVLRAEPTDHLTELVPNQTVRREFSTAGDGIARLDVWLTKSDNQSASAVVSLYTQGKLVQRLTVAPAQMTNVYPTILQFPTVPPSNQYLVEVSGNKSQVALTQDGALALKAYEPISIWNIPSRISFLQPYFYSPGFIIFLNAAYLGCLGAYLVLGARIVI